MEEIKKKRDPLCFVEVVDLPLSLESEVIEERIELAYADIQDSCETGGYVPLSTQQTVHTYSKLVRGIGQEVDYAQEHIVVTITVHIITHEELQRRQRLNQLGGNNGGPRRG